MYFMKNKIYLKVYENLKIEFNNNNKRLIIYFLG